MGPNRTGECAPPRTCPSGRCRENAVLLGIVSPDGKVAYITPQVLVDKPFVDRAKNGRIAEARFRFAEPCVEGGCENWVADRCGVIDRVIGSPEAASRRTEPGQPLPRCSIRSSCRWYSQWHAEACAICPLVVHSPDG